MWQLPHCWAGAITIAASLQVLSLLSEHYLGSTVGDEPMMEFDVYENPFRDEIVRRQFTLDQGYVKIPTGPGLGVEINEDAVKRYLRK